MFQNFDWIEAMRTSPVMIIILACSVVTTSFALERLLYFWRRRDKVEPVVQAALERIHDGDLKAAARECARSRHPFGSVAPEVLQNVHRTAAEAEEILHIALAEQRLLFERNLGLLGTMGNTAPLIGLLGTVWGIMRAFHDMASTGSAGPSVVAAGVAEALFTTAAGLLVAVPSVLLYNRFTRNIAVMMTVAENQARRLRLAAASPSPVAHRSPEHKRASESLEVVVRP